MGNKIRGSTRQLRGNQRAEEEPPHLQFVMEMTTGLHLNCMNNQKQEGLLTFLQPRLQAQHTGKAETVTICRVIHCKRTQS